MCKPIKYTNTAYSLLFVEGAYSFDPQGVSYYSQAVNQPTWVALVSPILSFFLSFFLHLISQELHWNLSLSSLTVHRQYMCIYVYICVYMCMCVCVLYIYICTIFDLIHVVGTEANTACLSTETTPRLPGVPASTRPSRQWRDSRTPWVPLSLGLSLSLFLYCYFTLSYRTVYIT